MLLQTHRRNVEDMKTQIITALSIAAVLGTAGGAYAVNQSVLSTASTSESTIGNATPVIVPVAPKGSDIPEEYLRQFEQATSAKPATSAPATSVQAAVPSSGTSTSGPSTGDDSSYNDDSSDDSDHEGDHEGDHEDESGDDD